MIDVERIEQVSECCGVDADPAVFVGDAWAEDVGRTFCLDCLDCLDCVDEALEQLPKYLEQQTPRVPVDDGDRQLGAEISAEQRMWKSHGIVHAMASTLRTACASSCPPAVVIVG